jgi:flagellar motor switch/type III secretory pathway protein FliN
MADAVLDPNELAAIRGAIGQALSAAIQNEPAVKDATPIALIADDRAADRARPDGLRIVERWMPLARSHLMRGYGVKIDLASSSAEIVSGAVLRDELDRAFIRVVEVKERASTAMVAITGPVIEAVAGRMLGSGTEDLGADRAPSIASLSVFGRAGETIIGALATAWHEEQSVHIHTRSASESDRLRREILAKDSLLVLTIEITGLANGRLRLIAHPETIAAPMPVERHTAPSTAIVARALAEVPVELRVDLGSTKLTIAEITALQPGALLTLEKPVDALLAVRASNVVLAYGRPTISKGALAIEIAGAEENNT